jgi:4-oxalocrotonate tautomerase family enzyme
MPQKISCYHFESNVSVLIACYFFNSTSVQTDNFSTKGESIMPVINMTMAPTTTDIRKALIEGLTEKAVEITGMPIAAFIVTLNELPEDALGCAGQTVAEMKRNLPR